METTLARDFFLWCAIINYGILMCWFFCFVVAHDWMLRWHCRWFRMSTEQIYVVHYGGMAVYKIVVLLFNLVPYVALLIMAGGGG